MSLKPTKETLRLLFGLIILVEIGVTLKNLNYLKAYIILKKISSDTLIKSLLNFKKFAFKTNQSHRLDKRKKFLVISI
jgi:hypothetical protein